MKCCAPCCKNDSRRVPKSQGITFHIFPFDASLRQAWLKALGKETWEPKAHNAVCSEHFLWDDLYVTKSGLRKVRSGAVPLIVQKCCDSGKPSAFRACRICLNTDVKLYSIRQYKLEEAFQNLSGISLSEEDKLPQRLCVECVYRLLNSSRLRQKCLQANSLMLELVQKDNQLTKKNIKTINRITNKLISPLSYKHYEVNHFDTFINEDSSIEIEDKCPIKQENEVFLTDVVIDKNDEFIDNGFNESGFNDLEINEPGINDPEINEPGINEPKFEDPEINETGITDALENDNDSDREYIIVSDKDVTYSSDDSLPLEKCKKKKRKKRKEKVDEPVQNVKRVKKTEIPAEPKIDRRRKPFLNNDLNETLFTITNLTLEEQIADIEKRQESSNYKNAIFKCTVCFKGFLDEDAYNGHMSRHTDECGEHACGICKTHFKHPHALRKHITAHHTQRFSCNSCTYVTTHRQTARLHERWHKGTRYTCPHCQDQFVKFTTYMGHIRIKHPSDFVCELCGYSFISAKGIELHKKLKHRLDKMEIPDDGPLCEECNVRFVSTAAHKRHLSVSARHSSGPNKESNKPKRGPKSKDELVRLAREKGKEPDEEKRRYPSQVRKAEGPISCEQCGMQLEDSRAYHGHFRRMHPDKNRTKYPSMKSPCMCEMCGRMFQSYALLKDHTWVHTGERPFKCESCGKSFRMKQRLVTHMKVHSQVRASYGCNVCGKHFSTHSNRQRHMFIHTGLKPFKCEMCGKGFKHSSEKRAHITYVHLKKPWPKRARGKRRSEPRQGPLPPQEQNIEIDGPVWPPCDPKLGEIGPMMENKPVYYNLKI